MLIFLSHFFACIFRGYHTCFSFVSHTYYHSFCCLFVTSFISATAESSLFVTCLFALFFFSLHIDVSFNQIKAIPSSIIFLSSLKELTIEGNPIKEPPPKVPHVHHLHSACFENRTNVKKIRHFFFSHAIPCHLVAFTFSFFCAFSVGVQIRDDSDNGLFRWTKIR